ncbi:DUF3124 domain-containing protein [Nostoc sp. FACHB-152]|uniref:DUF3124 domain-containing protein n=1 Tax=unclassified Nostoc TaxID=2593658 RepID=UPI0016821679|nr:MULTISPECIES: DUF3124 domain-containing protein [unclassified Nostoc]MBD2448611.1 DUF3124 domain-containing protein [Nostoc sp. FACHB-152]MBD2469921.1 DUF3124 domain-containing protein [Nostoc sp. FACHB-145]
MKLYRRFYLVIIVILLVSCQSLKSSPQPKLNTNEAKSSAKVVTLDKNFKIVKGQTIYVPVYSEIYHHNRQEIFYLAATLSIRNTDLNSPIIITSVRYYDTNGKLVKQYLENPTQLDALASTDFFVTRDDTSGGVGANFIVEWVAAQEISEPIVEAVMIGTDFQQGISFISPGRVIKDEGRRQAIGNRQ